MRKWQGIDKQTEQQQPTQYIGGKWVRGFGKPFSSKNPATGAEVWQGPAASHADIDQAVKAARTAFGSWMEQPIEKRISYLEKFQAILKSQREDLALVISEETGKPLWESLSEISSIINKVTISIDAYQKRCPDLIHEQPHQRSITRHKPHGVIAVLGPFNFPGHLPHGHIIPALLAGNTVVFKPSEYAPLVGLQLVKCWVEAGLPPGVFNLVQGGREVGSYLSRHEQINGLFFTGSYTAGQALAEHFSKHLDKILVLELGGNNPLIVSDVADLKAAAYITIQSAYLTAGQRCSCARRLIVPQGEKGDAFIKELTAMIKGIHVGPYTDTPEPFMGPVISEEATVRLLSAEASLLFMGATAVVSMHLKKEGSYLLGPGLIDVTEVENRQDEEYFGPLLQLIRVPDFAAAIREANSTIFGLSAGLLSDKKEEYDLFYRQIRAGVVNWNTPLTGASSAAPFGGVGCSGNHHPSAYYAADYCVYPVASSEKEKLFMPEKLTPGVALP